jgi:hypothetical protein
MFSRRLLPKRMSHRFAAHRTAVSHRATAPTLAERWFSAARIVGRGIRARIEDMTSDGEQSTTGPSEETKRKFREALERKNKASKQREGEAHLDGGGGAQQTQGPADHKREFRRKSG